MSADNEYVITGALMKCSEGVSPMPFKATPRTSKIAGLLAGNELDIAPIINIPSFIVCKKLTQMANGMPVPCIPAPGKWQDTYKAKIGGGKALIKKSCIQCATAKGKMEFITSGQLPLPPEVVHDIQITQQEGEAALQAAEKEKNSVGEAGFLEGLIPVWGSGRDLIHAAQTGDSLGVALNAGFLVWDAVSIVVGALSFGTATAVMMGAKAGIRTTLKAAGKVVVSAAKKQGAEMLIKSAALSREAINLIKEFLPKIPTKSCAVCCFPGGIPIAVKGGFKNIEDIRTGDLVWSWNEVNGEIGLKPVISTFEREADALIELDFGMERFKATPEHPFWIGEAKKGAWKDAGDLVEGDQVWLLDKRNVALLALEHQPQPENNIKVYNFEVADWHTYFVGWWMVLVHNSDPYDEAAEQAAKKINELSEAAKVGDSVLSKTLEELQIIAKQNASAFRKLFGSNKEGAQSVLNSIENIKVPEGLTREAMQAYRELINRVSDPTGVQVIRAEILDRLLK